MPTTTHWTAPPWLQALPDQLPSWVDERPQVPWNLVGLLRSWSQHPKSMDFLDPESPNFSWKALQTRMYQELLDGVVELSPTRPQRILDAACGVGRFLVPLVNDGHEVVGIDACRPSLEAAERHLVGLSQESGKGSATLIWGDVEELVVPYDLVPDESFDVVLAMELLCYLADPASVARSLAKRLRPGGCMVVSVEAWPGALLTDLHAAKTVGMERCLEERVLAVPLDRWVHPFDAQELASILQGAGLEVLSIRGTHYLPDGPMMDLIDPNRVGTPDYDNEV
ncbi:MAG TPA: hypothetical protein DIU15_04500, partial [Deltaproteobacteria bacterium]|nr:hypothetical protein [Deltaproteobacteria bacterium]